MFTIRCTSLYNGLLFIHACHCLDNKTKVSRVLFLFDVDTAKKGDRAGIAAATTTTTTAATTTPTRRDGTDCENGERVKPLLKSLVTRVNVTTHH